MTYIKSSHLWSEFYNEAWPKNPHTQKRESLLITLTENIVADILFKSIINARGGLVSSTDTKYGKYTRMAQQIGEQLASIHPRPGIHYEFKVVQNSEEPALNFLAGKIIISIDLIKGMGREGSLHGFERAFSIEEKIAAVLAHEIIHTDNRDVYSGLCRKIVLLLLTGTIYKQLLKLLQGYISPSNPHIHAIKKAGDYFFLLSLVLNLSKNCYKLFSFKKSRQAESHADSEGMRLIAQLAEQPSKPDWCKPDSARAQEWVHHYFKDCYDNQISYRIVNFFFNIFRTHPLSDQRIANCKKVWQDIQAHQAQTAVATV